MWSCLAIAPYGMQVTIRFEHLNALMVESVLMVCGIYQHMMSVSSIAAL